MHKTKTVTTLMGTLETTINYISIPDTHPFANKRLEVALTLGVTTCQLLTNLKTVPDTTHRFGLIDLRSAVLKLM